MKFTNIISKLKLPSYDTKVNIPKPIISLLSNKYVLYMVSLLSLITVIGYLYFGKFYSLFYFILIASVLRYYTSNMNIILIVPLLLVTFISYITTNNREGLENKEEEKKDENKIKEVLQKHIASSDKTDIAPVVPHHEDVENKVSETDEAFEVGIQKGGKRSNIDYSTTIEDAYNELNKIIGGDGIKKLTEDTQLLMNQQKGLAEAMQNLTPVMEQAKSMLQGMDIKNLGNIANLAKSFNISGN